MSASALQLVRQVGNGVPVLLLLGCPPAAVPDCSAVAAGWEQAAQQECGNRLAFAHVPSSAVPLDAVELTPSELPALLVLTKSSSWLVRNAERPGVIGSLDCGRIESLAGAASPFVRSTASDGGVLTRVARLAGVPANSSLAHPGCQHP